MNAVYLLTKVSAKPSRRVLKKAVLFALASNKSLRIYAEDYRRSEEHTFLDFLLHSEESSVRYDDYFMQWCDSVLEQIEEIRAEYELASLEVNFELLSGSNWEKQLTHQCQGYNDLFLIDYAKGVLAPQILRKLSSQSNDILLLTEKKWSQKLKLATAIDPLHRGDKNAEIDKAIINRSIDISSRLNASTTLVYCQYVAPYLYRYSKEILSNQKLAIQEFLNLNKFYQLPLRLIEANPEEGLPNAVNSLDASILAMGACKRTALSRYWSGSTVDVLIANPPCDLLLITK
ncbi:universal stress protein [Vibrio sp. TRT 29B02]|uniref:universal stress protein n=1 Tax=Vibrio sp. TRT 29B02 TaxID=3418508 RepID=UPI003CEDD591